MSFSATKVTVIRHSEFDASTAGPWKRCGQPFGFHLRTQRWLIIGNSPPGRAVEILILTALQRPEKSAQARQTKAKRQRHEKDEDFHHGLRGTTRRTRSAFKITSREEPDIAAAATSGVA